MHQLIDGIAYNFQGASSCKDELEADKLLSLANWLELKSIVNIEGIAYSN